MKLKPRHKPKPEIPLSSMADVAMLLLMFFVICGKATNRSVIAVDPPLSLSAERLPRVDRVIVSVNAAGETFLDGRMVDGPELLAELEAIMADRRDREARTVLIEVDRRTAYKDYVVAVEAVNRVKGYVELKVKQ